MLFSLAGSSCMLKSLFILLYAYSGCLWRAMSCASNLFTNILYKQIWFPFAAFVRFKSIELGEQVGVVLVKTGGHLAMPAAAHKWKVEFILNFSMMWWDCKKDFSNRRPKYLLRRRDLYFLLRFMCHLVSTLYVLYCVCYLCHAGTNKHIKCVGNVTHFFLMGSRSTPAREILV